MKERIAAAASFALALFVSCTAGQDIVLNAAGGAEVSISVDLHPMLIGYLDDLSSVKGALEGEPLAGLVDFSILEDRFSRWEGAELTDAAVSCDGRLSVRFTVSDLSAFAADLARADGIPGLLTYSRSGSKASLGIVLDPGTVQGMLSLASPGENPLIDVFGPQPGVPYGEEEYTDMVSYAFEEYAGDEGIPEILSASRLVITVTAPASVIAVTGGVRTGSKTARFSIPFMEIVTITEAVRFGVEYR